MQQDVCRCCQRMSASLSSRHNSCVHVVIALLAAFGCCCPVASFEPDPGHYSTPHEAIEYFAWTALKEGRPPCITVHPIAISLFCIMGQCVRDGNGSSHCQCDEYFAGLTCSVYKGKCTSESLCGPHLCRDNPDKMSAFECVCKPGYHVPEHPAISHCVPDSPRQKAGATGSKDRTGSASTLPATAPAGRFAEAALPANSSLSSASTSLLGSIPLWGKNISKLAALCSSSDFRTCFVEPEGNTTVGTLFREALQNAVEQGLAQSMQAVENPNSSSKMHAAPNVPPSATNTAAKQETTTEVSVGAAAELSAGLENADVPAQAIDHGLSLSTQQQASRPVNMPRPIIRRRHASTFQVKQAGIFANELILADETSSLASRKEHAAGKGKHMSALFGALSLRHRMPVSTAHGNQLVTRGTVAPLQSVEQDSLEEEDYEVAQFRRKLIEISPAELAKSAGGIRPSVHKPPSHIVGVAATRKAVVERNYAEDARQRPVEVQDEIIDGLRRAVEASENGRANGTKKPRHKGKLLKKAFLVADKRKRRKISVLQKSNTASIAKNEQKPLQTQHGSANRGPRPTKQHKNILGLEQHSSQNEQQHELTRSLGTMRHSELGDKMLGTNWGEVSDSVDNPVSTPIEVFGLTNEEFSISLTKSVHQVPKSEGERHFTSHFKDYPSVASYTSPFPKVSTVSANMPQILNEVKISSAEVKNFKALERIDQLQMSHPRDKRVMKPSKFIRRVHSRARKRRYEVFHDRHFRRRDPMLFLNVTVLGAKESNTSAVSYIVPSEGSKAVVISWGIYHDDSS